MICFGLLKFGSTHQVIFDDILILKQLCLKNKNKAIVLPIKYTILSNTKIAVPKFDTKVLIECLDEILHIILDLEYSLNKKKTKCEFLTLGVFRVNNDSKKLSKYSRTQLKILWSLLIVTQIIPPTHKNEKVFSRTYFRLKILVHAFVEFRRHD